MGNEGMRHMCGGVDEVQTYADDSNTEEDDEDRDR